MVLRFTTALIGLPLLLVIVLIGLPWFSILLVAVATIGAVELWTMFSKYNWFPLLLIAVICSVSPIITSQMLTTKLYPEIVTIITVLCAIAAFVFWQICRISRNTMTCGIVAILGSCCCLGVLLAHAVLIRSLDNGSNWILFLIVVTFTVDTSAFFVGKYLGRTPLAPSISPNKTLEGAMGGFLGALMVSLAMGLLFQQNVPVVIMIGALLGINGQLGDLIESKIKRVAGVKDSGHIMPGHGGLLDTVDSIVANLPVVYYFLVWVIL